MCCNALRIWFLAAALALVAGCAEFPKPFKPEKRTLGITPLLQLPDGAGIVIRPVEGVLPPISNQLRSAMVDALAKSNVPASTVGGNQASYVLDSRLVSRSTGHDRKMVILWVLRDAQDQVMGRYLQHKTAREEEWTSAKPELFAAVAASAAPEIADFIQDDTPAARPTLVEIGIAVRSIEGAPGDGRATLTRALKYHLRQANVPVLDDLNENAIVVLGKVELGPVHDGEQPVAINWRVLAPGGGEVGRIDQNNSVPAGLLDEHWGEIAFMVAEGAAAGIVALLDQSGPVDAVP